VRAASTLHFPQYDQLVVAAMEGSGVAIGVLPHVAQHVRDGVLCAPFGPKSIVRVALSSSISAAKVPDERQLMRLSVG
jgi:hypothetical protein